MMEEEDPRVKKLQDLAWSLQTMTNKPGGKFPEAFKRECYQVTSKALSLCSNANYTEETDFLERAKVFEKQIEAQKVKVGEVEKAEIEKLSGKCLRQRPGGGGGYAVEDARGTPAGAVGAGAGAAAMTSSGGAAVGITVKEVAARCAEDPEALWLHDMELRDSDLDAICEGVRQNGGQLTALDLSHNSIADEGVQKLVTALARGACPRLQDLWLDGNAIGPLGERMLADGLGALRRGLKVHVSGAGSGRDGGAPRPAAASGDPPAAPVAPPGAAAPPAAAPAAPAAAPAAPSAPPGAASPAGSPSPAVAAAPAQAEPTPSAESRGCGVELLAADGAEEVRVTIPMPEDVGSAQE
ncbi:unnamed protein product, partial [Prorocentrum cordatum]